MALTEDEKRILYGHISLCELSAMFFEEAKRNGFNWICLYCKFGAGVLQKNRENCVCEHVQDLEHYPNTPWNINNLVEYYKSKVKRLKKEMEKMIEGGITNANNT